MDKDKARKSAITATSATTSKSANVANRDPDFDKSLISELSFLYKISRRYSFDPSDREDIVSETVASALRYSYTFDKLSNFRGWLRSIMRSVSYLRYQKSLKLPEVKDNSIMEFLAVDGDQEKNMAASEIMEVVKSGPHLETMMMIINGHSMEDVADIEGISKQRVHQKMKRARAYYRTTGVFGPSARMVANA